MYSKCLKLSFRQFLSGILRQYDIFPATKSYLCTKEPLMLLSEFLMALNQVESLRFQTPSGDFVPNHFHITEVGKVGKHFIDCGGTERKEEVINFQLWTAEDVDHRLQPQKVMNIIRLSQRRIGLTDAPIEVEYQGDTVGKYALSFDGAFFHLQNKFTDCLAKENCGIPETDTQQSPNNSCCDPDSGCC